MIVLTYKRTIDVELVKRLSASPMDRRRWRRGRKVGELGQRD
jgi:hypothetical protein